MTDVQFAQVLQLTESNADPKAFGDAGLALTSYQVHPAWLWDRIQHYHLAPAVDESWDSWVGRYVAAFFNTLMTDATPVEIAMHFHLGHYAASSDPDWDQAYADRFNQFAVKVVATS